MKSADEALSFVQQDLRLVRKPVLDVPHADFKFDGEWRECRIWEGYFRASCIILEEAINNQEANSLIFPAIFNLRHAVEVALKWHIPYAGGVVPSKAGHNLIALRDAFVETASDLGDDASYISKYAIDCISELACLDPHALAFRYSTRLDGTPITISPKSWDLPHLLSAVDVLSLWFDDLSNKIELSRNELYQAWMRGERENPY